jgi:hypothetical protein
MESFTGKTSYAIQQAMIGKLRFYSQHSRRRQAKPWGFPQFGQKARAFWQSQASVEMPI